MKSGHAGGFPMDHKHLHRIYTLFRLSYTVTIFGTRLLFRHGHTADTKMTNPHPLLSATFTHDNSKPQFNPPASYIKINNQSWKMPPPDVLQPTPPSSLNPPQNPPHPVRSSSQLLPTALKWLWFLRNALLLCARKFNNGNSDPALFPVLLHHRALWTVGMMWLALTWDWVSNDVPFLKVFKINKMEPHACHISEAVGMFCQQHIASSLPLFKGWRLLLWDLWHLQFLSVFLTLHGHSESKLWKKAADICTVSCLQPLPHSIYIHSC